jgi:hypothetical protein
MRWFASTAKTPRLRTLLEFAEQELIVPEGKYRGTHFRVRTQPYAGLLLRAMGDRRWNRRAVLGCVQAGKSLIGFVAPILYHLFEHRETVICGVPTREVGRDKWNDELLPAIRACRFARYLPESGRGSRGGFAEEVAFTNGVKLKFMSGHGGDEKRSSYTARVVVLTEADKMDEAGESSRETDPVSQMEARMESYDIDERQFYEECTVSIPTGRIWTDYNAGTASRIVCPCVHCGAWVSPEREHFVGWQDTETQIAARKLGHFLCPACGAALSDDNRRTMNLAAKLVHRGEEIAPDGTVVGQPAETDTLGFRWNAWNNLFWSSAAIAAKEWDGTRALDTDAAERELCQFVWAVPWEPPFEDSHLDVKLIQARKDVFEENVLPADAEQFVIHVDVGKWQSWFLAMVRRKSGAYHVPAYGVLEVHSDSMPVKTALMSALRDFRERVSRGWPVSGRTEKRLPDYVTIDSAWEPDTVFAFCKESGSRYLPTRGNGLSLSRREDCRIYFDPDKRSKDIRVIGPGWHLKRIAKYGAFQLVVNADRYKRDLQQGLVLDPREPGAIVLFDAPEANRHNKLARHFAAQRLVDAEKGKWERLYVHDHWLDCGYNTLAAISYLQVKSHAAAEAPTSWWSRRKKQS